jgi:hypothetical protein
MAFSSFISSPNNKRSWELEVGVVIKGLRSGTAKQPKGNHGRSTWASIDAHHNLTHISVAEISVTSLSMITPLERANQPCWS